MTPKSLTVTLLFPRFVENRNESPGRFAEPPVKVQDEKLLFGLIRAAFGQRRKTLTNSVGNAQDLGISKEQVADALRQLGLSETIRGEALTLEQFGALSEVLHG